MARSAVPQPSQRAGQACVRGQCVVVPTRRRAATARQPRARASPVTLEPPELLLEQQRTSTLPAPTQPRQQPARLADRALTAAIVRCSSARELAALVQRMGGVGRLNGIHLSASLRLLGRLTRAAAACTPDSMQQQQQQQHAALEGAGPLLLQLEAAAAELMDAALDNRPVVWRAATAAAATASTAVGREGRRAALIPPAGCGCSSAAAGAVPPLQPQQLSTMAWVRCCRIRAVLCRLTTACCNPSERVGESACVCVSSMKSSPTIPGTCVTPLT
jgi:hypothetical protein